MNNCCNRDSRGGRRSGGAAWTPSPCFNNFTIILNTSITSNSFSLNKYFEQFQPFTKISQ